MKSAITLLRLAVILSIPVALSACGTIDRLSKVGQDPELTPIQNPVASPQYQPVTLPMPAPQEATFKANSLWRQNARAFFKDQRASRVGDILTVKINITDRARLANSTNRTRSASENAELPSFLGFEAGLTRFLPDAVNPDALTRFGSGSSQSGSGTINREENVAMTVAATVVQTLPNGNLVIMGRQEVRVNHEVRELILTGVVRPEDITNSNTIEHSQIAEARISYGGRGNLTDVQRARYGQQIYEILFPF
jgi:flagellar L-ring protein precursor FlgH